MLWAKTAAMESAASLSILLSPIPITVRFERFCKPFMILIAPAAFKLLSLRYNSSSLALWDKTAAMSSAASSLILL